MLIETCASVGRPSANEKKRFPVLDEVYDQSPRLGRRHSTNRGERLSASEGAAASPKTPPRPGLGAKLIPGSPFIIHHSPFIILLIFLIPALQPLLRADLTCGYDNAFHLWRAVQVERLWQQGVFLSRWAPDMALGFGFPLPLFMPTGTAYLVAALYRLGLTWPVALNASFVLGVVLGAVFMYSLARELFGPYAGLPAAVAYAYAPFQAYDVFYRGSLSESFAWAFPPLIIWALQRWGVRRDRKFLLVGALGFAALLVSHNPFAFLFAPLFGLWVLVTAYLARQPRLALDWRVLVRGVLLGLLGLGLAALFWLPGLVERGWVQADRLLGTWVFDYQQNFISLDHLLAWPRNADPALINDWPEKALGALPVALAFLTLLRWKCFSPVQRWYIGLLAGIAVGFAFLTLSPSLWLWDHVPLLAYIQFPWRYLGPAAFCVALLIGALLAPPAVGRGRSSVVGRGLRPLSPAAPRSETFGEQEGETFGEQEGETFGEQEGGIFGEREGVSSSGQILSAVFLSLVLILGNLGWFYPRHCAPPLPISPSAGLGVRDMIAWERATDTLGTTAKGEYLPIWVERMPEVSLDTDYATSGPVVRLRQEDLPEGATVVRAAYGALGSTIELDTPEAFQARYLAFYYPGWCVTVDGTPVEVSPAPETGLVTFPVPAGRHTITIRFTETPLRLAADALSLVSFLILAIVTFQGIREAFCHPERDRRVYHSETSSQRCWDEATSLPLSKVWRGGRGMRFDLYLLAIAFVALKVLLLDHLPMPWHHTNLQSDGTLQGVTVPLNINFDGRARLLGMDPPPDAFAADAAPQVRFYAQALDHAGRDWRLGLTLLDPDGRRWMPDSLRAPRATRAPPPMPEWPPGTYALWAYHVDVLSGAPPGTYTLAVSLFDRDTLVPASVLGPDGNPQGPSLPLCTLQLERPAHPPTLAELGVLGADVILSEAEGSSPHRCGTLGLWAMTADRTVAAPGDPVGLRWVWEALRAPSEVLTMTVTLRDTQGRAVRAWRLPPVAIWWPTDRWLPGDRWVGRHVLRLPGGLTSGHYQLFVSLPGCADLASVSLDAAAPERTWEVPASMQSWNTVLGDRQSGLVRLAGVAVEPQTLAPGESAHVTMAWQALAEMTASYHVFLHMLGSNGQIIAQNDGEPVNWTRPTTGWAVGEVVVETREVQIPGDAAPGTYTLQVGLYRPEDGRLRTEDGDDAVQIGTLEVK